MNTKTIQEFLPFISRPSRYLGTEINSIHKSGDDVKLRIALAFPDLYEIGTSHFGLQILYGILNSCKHIQAERIYAPGPDMEARLKSSGAPLTSLESGRPLATFDIIGFSLLYELNYTNILTMLDLSQIPFYADQRDESFPLIIAGGPCMCNPEPVADFFDAIVIGDGEEVIVHLTQAYSQWKTQKKPDKAQLLKLWSGIEGVYIPSLFSNSSAGCPVPLSDNYQTVTRAIVPDLNQAFFPCQPVIPFGRPVHDRLKLEIARGCSRGCRFCQAGMIYRPVRERSPQLLLNIAEQSLAATGYEDLSLLSLSTGDYSCIREIMEIMVPQLAREHTAISFPSLRAGTLTPELMQHIKAIRKTGFTIAPEAGTQRLRNVINKNITEQEIFDTVDEAFKMGWRVIKLYFMIGLPTETDEDIEGLVQMVKRLNQHKSKIRTGKINVSIGIFVPKPHTPFQWAAQIPLEKAKDRIGELKSTLKLPGINLKWHKPEVSLLEGLFSRGDRRLSRLLISAYQHGCRFDGWSDKFLFEGWKAAMADVDDSRSEGAPADQRLGDEKDDVSTGFSLEEVLPWDHIDMRISRDFLRSEWDKALREELTQDCRSGDCTGCGCCDHDKLQPIVCSPNELTKPQTLPEHPEDSPEPKVSLEITYCKMEQAAWFGHLEMVSCFIKAMRRAKIPLAYSKGFHPMPHISFQDPLPSGMESQEEKLYLKLLQTINSEEFIKQLNQQLPAGLKVLHCRPAPPKALRRPSLNTVYEITLPNGSFQPKPVKQFHETQTIEYSRTNLKGKTTIIDLKHAVLNLEIKEHNVITMTLRSEVGKTVRPVEVLEKIFGGAFELVRVVKLGSGV